MVSSCLQMEVSVTGTVGTLAQRQWHAAALSSAKDASTEGGTWGSEAFFSLLLLLLSALPVLKAIKEQISSQREGR